MRDLQEALYLFAGHLFSRDAINRITQNVQQTLDDWQNRPIEETPEILIVDGVWVKILYPTGETFIDKSGHKRQQPRLSERVILVAMGVEPNGNSYVVGSITSPGEDQNGWAQLFEHLIARGFDAQSVKMVVSDGAQELLAAMETYLPNAHLQRCVVHKVRGFERYLTYEDLPKTDPNTGQPMTAEQAKKQRRQQMKNEALAIFLAPTKTEAKDRLSAFVSKWEPIEKKAVRNFTGGIKRCFTFYQFDSAIHHKIRSTNAIERFFREFRAKADEIGAFPNQLSCMTLFYLVMVREHAKHDRIDFAKTS